MPGDQVAFFLGVTPARVSQLKKERVLSGTKDGYLLSECIKAYVEYKEARVRDQLRDNTRAKLDAEKVKKMQIERRQKSGELIAIDESLALFSEIIGVFKSSLLGTGTRCARTQPELRRKIDDYIDDAFNRAASRFDQEVEALRSRVTPGDAAEENDAGRVGGGE